jgi:Fe-S cluster assembly ATP-binding protein
MSNLLKIKKLNVGLRNKKILKNLNLEINENEIHFLLGPNGSGKTTFVKYLGGFFKDKKNLTAYFLNSEISFLSPEQRLKMGLFITFQFPPEISELKTSQFLRILYNKKRIIKSQFKLNIIKYFRLLKLDLKLLKRNFNENFSGGEKKKFEILLLLFYISKLIILDEIDSGLDINAIKNIFNILKKKSLEGVSFLIITHFLFLTYYIQPTHVHVLRNGKIIKSGYISLLKALKEKNIV